MLFPRVLADYVLTLEAEMQNADESKMEMYEKMYKDFAAIGASLEKDIQNIYTSVQQISKEYEDIIKITTLPLSALCFYNKTHQSTQTRRTISDGSPFESDL